MTPCLTPFASLSRVALMASFARAACLQPARSPLQPTVPPSAYLSLPSMPSPPCLSGPRRLPGPWRLARLPCPLLLAYSSFLPACLLVSARARSPEVSLPSPSRPLDAFLVFALAAPAFRLRRHLSPRHSSSLLFLVPPLASGCSGPSHRVPQPRLVSPRPSSSTPRSPRSPRPASVSAPPRLRLVWGDTSLSLSGGGPLGEWVGCLCAGRRGVRPR